MEPVNIIIALIGIILTIAAFVYGRQSASHADGNKDGNNFTELGLLGKSTQDDIPKASLTSRTSATRDYISRLTCVEEARKSAPISE